MSTLFLSKQCVIFDVITAKAAKCEFDGVCLQTLINKQFCIAAAGLLDFTGGAPDWFCVYLNAEQVFKIGVAMLVPMMSFMSTGLWHAHVPEPSANVE